MSGHSGTTGKVVTATSGIEIALWDAVGKILDLPMYQLLVGSTATGCGCTATATRVR